jgi:biopolymer transport protein ExbD
MAIAKRLEETPDELGEDGGDGNLFAEINITPLTDVFLVMVVIFMVSALAVQAEQNQQKKIIESKEKVEQQDKSRGLKINLPSGEAQEIDPSKASLVLEVPLSGNVVVGGKEFTDERIDDLFRAAFAKDKATQVILKADKGVQHGRVVNLMERAKKSGLTRLAIGTGK